MYDTLFLRVCLFWQEKRLSWVHLAAGVWRSKTLPTNNSKLGDTYRGQGSGWGVSNQPVSCHSLIMIMMHIVCRLFIIYISVRTSCRHDGVYLSVVSVSISGVCMLCNLATTICHQLLFYVLYIYKSSINQCNVITNYLIVQWQFDNLVVNYLSDHQPSLTLHILCILYIVIVIQLCVYVCALNSV